MQWQVQAEREMRHTAPLRSGEDVYKRQMPAAASGAKPILFGDLSYFWLLQRQELTIKPLFELFSNKGQVGYAAYERLDGKLVRQDAVRTLTVK